MSGRGDVAEPTVELVQRIRGPLERIAPDSGDRTLRMTTREGRRERAIGRRGHVARAIAAAKRRPDRRDERTGRTARRFDLTEA